MLPTATATSTPAPTATPTLAPVPTPANVPAGWVVLDTPHFSLAYPSGWGSHTLPQQDGSMLYLVSAPGDQMAVRVLVQEQVQDPSIGAYCAPVSGDVRHVTLAGLPMTYAVSGEGQAMRAWVFANAQRTVFALDASDAQSGGANQAEDDAILATFRPDNATPWRC